MKLSRFIHILKTHADFGQAAELPLTRADKSFWPQDLLTLLDQLETEGVLSRTAEGNPMWLSTRRTPQLSVNIRSSRETFTIFERETDHLIYRKKGVKARLRLLVDWNLERMLKRTSNDTHKSR